MSATPFGSTGAATSADATMRAINDACRRRGGAYATYSCKYVSWDDSSRGINVGSGLSCWGPNITDTYLKAKDGTRLFTVRPDNWDERLGTASSSEIAVVAGGRPPRSDPGLPWGPTTATPLRPITLRDLLKSMGEHGSYAGLPASCDLSSDELDGRCSVRFQATFLPVRGGAFGSWREALEFATEAYNYQTRSDDDPKNLVLLCTTQGVAVQQDGAGATRLYHHSVDSADRIHRHWLEAERTAHAVGGPQFESDAERADAIARGKATASVIGPRELGPRFNVLMTVQVPLRQKTAIFGGPVMAFGAYSAPPPAPAAPFAAFGAAAPATAAESGAVSNFAAFGAAAPATAAESGAVSNFASSPFSSLGGFGSAPPKVGSSNAARVSIGSEHDIWPGLRGNARSPRRHETEHPTVTIVLYNVVGGGVPSEEDVVAAIDDLEGLYKACRAVLRRDAEYANADPTAAAPKPPAVLNPESFPSPATGNDVTSSFKYITPFRDVTPDLLGQIRAMPLSLGTFTYVHDLGQGKLSPKFAARSSLLEAFGLFRLADEIHSQLCGRPAPSALYNLACVCSRLSAKADSGAVADPGPLASNGACLDAAAVWLRAAAAAGWSDHVHMRADEDLAELRARRTAKFELAVQIAQAVAEAEQGS